MPVTAPKALDRHLARQSLGDTMAAGYNHKKEKTCIEACCRPPNPRILDQSTGNPTCMQDKVGLCLVAAGLWCGSAVANHGTLSIRMPGAHVDVGLLHMKTACMLSTSICP